MRACSRASARASAAATPQEIARLHSDLAAPALDIKTWFRGATGAGSDGDATVPSDGGLVAVVSAQEIALFHLP